MNNPELRQLLEQLHSEIEHTETVDEKGQALLRDLAQHIQVVLARSEAGATPPPLSLEGIQANIDHFEITHPTLTTTLLQLLRILGNAGI